MNGIYPDPAVEQEARRELKHEPTEGLKQLAERLKVDLDSGVLSQKAAVLLAVKAELSQRDALAATKKIIEG